MKIKKFAALILSLLVLTSCTKKPIDGVDSKPDFTSVPSASQPSSSIENNTIIKSAAIDDYKAIWISFLEWQFFDISSVETFTKSVGETFDNCKNMGINTVIVHARPFSDATYKSAIFPWSHIVSGLQGTDPGYDPFGIMVNEAHARGFRIEAWINPYRIAIPESLAASPLSSNNIAITRPDLVKQTETGTFLKPANAEVQKLIVDGVKEIITNYNVDGVHFDDYFYPVTGEDFDSEDYAVSGTKLALADWRRENVNTLIKQVYSSIKQINPELTFGISPQGNNENNYNKQYSDVGLWLSTPGYVDYIMPQIYWGYGYLTASGRTDYQYEKLCNDFAAMPRHSSVKLYLGLGAYRIGVGDNGSYDQLEWQSGHNIADMITTAKGVKGISGWSLYDYKSLFHNANYAELAAAEAAAISSVNAQ